MSKEVKIGIISHDSTLQQALEKIVSQYVKVDRDLDIKVKLFTQLPSIEDAIVHFAPRLLIVHIQEQEKDEKLAFLSHLTRVAARIPIVVCTSEAESDFILNCVKRGVSDFLKYPLDADEVRETFARLLERSNLDTQYQRLGSIYTFFSYKGGVGTTFLACNVAVALARVTGKTVLLWDMVLQNGDVPFFLDHEPKVTVTDLISNIDAIDVEYLKGALPPIKSGISVLASPRSPEEADSVSHEQTQQLYQTLRKYYDYIVVDGGHAFTDPIIGIMDACHYIVFPTDLHLPVLKNTLRCIEVFEKFGYVEEKFKIVINRYNSKYEEIDLEKAESILPYPIAFAFNNEYETVSRSLNTGIPMVDIDKRSPLTKQLEQFALMLVNGFEKKEKGKTGFKGFFKKTAPAPLPKAKK